MSEPMDNPRAPADPDGHYTLPRSRLAGSGACLNCGTPLKGPFCHYCGQPDRRIMRFFPVLLREFLEDFADFDSRFMRTLKPLLLRPGRLTRDFLDGRRFRYTPPLRLYLFSSIVFFLVAALAATGPLQVSSTEVVPGPSISLNADHVDESPGEEVSDGGQGVATGSGEEPDPGPDTLDEMPDLRLFSDEPWHRENNPVAIPLMPRRLNAWVNDEIAESPRKAREIADDPRAFVDQMLELLPGTMFVLLPVFALILKLWYLFAKRYYVEHLVLSLHNHAFLFVLMTLLVVLDTVATLLIGNRVVYWIIEAIGLVVFCWMPVYLLVSLKTVYQQSWWLTVLKGIAIWMTYSLLAMTVSAFIALLGFLLF